MLLGSSLLACSKPGGTTAVAVGEVEVVGEAASKNEPRITPDGCPEGMVRVEGNDTLQPFCMGETEVSVREFRQCVEAGKCREFDSKWDFLDPKKATWLLGDESMPINYVDEEQARQYCAFVGGRLPTADEWIWALGSTKGWAFPWGSEYSSEKNWYCGCWKRRGQMPADASLCQAKQYPDDRTLQGIYDLAGSADEIIGPNEKGEYGILTGAGPKGISLSDDSAPRNWTEKNTPDPWYAGNLVIWRDTTSLRCVVPR